MTRVKIPLNDADADSLDQRAFRIKREVEEIVDEAIRIRDEDRGMVDALRAELNDTHTNRKFVTMDRDRLEKELEGVNAVIHVYEKKSDVCDAFEVEVVSLRAARDALEIEGVGLRSRRDALEVEVAELRAYRDSTLNSGPLVPVSLIEYVRSEVVKLPSASGQHVLFGNVRLDELRLFLKTAAPK